MRVAEGMVPVSVVVGVVLVIVGSFRFVMTIIITDGFRISKSEWYKRAQFRTKLEEIP